jgi:F0F1-type ATP synthase membrane subunit b/b'
LEPTLSDLQAQIDQLSVAVQRAREAPGPPEALNQLTELAERCRGILKRWTDLDDRHAEAIVEVEARLGEWSAIESRLERESADRMRALEQAVEREWKALKDIHEAPAQQLRDQANALSETSVAAANLSLRAFERTEARLAALEADLHARLDQLSNDLHTSVNELRRDGMRTPSLPADVAPFPLEGVMRIHEEHREGPEIADRPAPPPDVPRALEMRAAQADRPAPTPPEGATTWSDRLASLEREVSSERNDVRETVARADKLRRNSLVTVIVAGVLILVVAVLGYLLEQNVTARLDEASARVNAAEHQAQSASETASREVASARADADRQIAEARETARRAELTSNVLAAPDVLRINLEGSDGTGRAGGQALFSRSVGLVVNTSRMSVLATGTAYEVWLIGSGGPVGVGFLVPDASGRAVLAIDTVPDVSRPVTGLMVTIEPTGGKAAPSGPIVLTRAPQ